VPVPVPVPEGSSCSRSRRSGPRRAISGTGTGTGTCTGEAPSISGTRPTALTSRAGAGSRWWAPHGAISIDPRVVSALRGCHAPRSGGMLVSADGGRGRAHV